MKKMTSQLALALAVFALAGCGLKGPLYFPEDEPAKQPTHTSSPTQSGSALSAPATSTGQDNQPVR